MGPRILLVEGKGSRALSFAPLLDKKGYSVTRAHTRRDALALLQAELPELLIVDSRFLRFDALRFCQTVRASEDRVLLLLIPGPGVQAALSDDAMAVLNGDLTPRRLLNRVKRLLSAPGKETLRVGEIVLDLKRRTVSRGGREHRLTPKQARLLEVFMRNTGRVLTRAFLMREVWDTDFVGDTRTLEVHIHWLRRAIERNPSRPAYLTTVRRLGYRFDEPPHSP